MGGGLLAEEVACVALSLFVVLFSCGGVTGFAVIAPPDEPKGFCDDVSIIGIEIGSGVCVCGGVRGEVVSILSGSSRLELQLLSLQVSESVAEPSPIEDGRLFRFVFRFGLFFEVIVFI